jgi:uncharacterized protein YkwD
VDTILVAAAIWLFLVVLGLAILRSAGQADRDAERRLRERSQRPRPKRRPAEAGRRAARVGVLVAALPLAGMSVGTRDADAAACRGAGSSAPAAASRATLCLINRERQARGLAALVENARLRGAASRYAADMVHRGYFSHVSPEGTTFVERLRFAGYLRRCGWSAGETLAWGSGTQASARSRVQAWMNSPPHRAVLLGASYRDAGVAVARGTPGTAPTGLTYVAELGHRRC